MTPWERLRGGLLAPPLPELHPAPLRSRVRFAGAVVTGVARPLSAVARAALRVSGGGGALRPERIGSVAFVKLDHLGDFLMATPLVRALKRWAPGARITVYTRPANAEVALRLAGVDEVELADVPWIRPGASSRENLGACLSLARDIRARGFDLAVDLRYHNRMDSLLLSLCGARARLGFDAAGGGFGITHCAPWPDAAHEAERGAAALRYFGIPVGDLSSEFPLAPAEAAAARRLIGGRGKFVAVHVGAGNPVKRWMPDRFAWVARELARRARVRVAVLAGKGEESRGEALVRAVPRRSLVDLRGRLRLPEMAAVIGESSLFLGGDGGAGHVAAAVRAKALIIFSGTNTAEQWRPAGKNVEVIEKSVPCKPCRSTICPYDQACLRAVTVDEVLEAALRLVRGR